MKLIQEYKTQCIYILFGLIVLLFPFLHPAYLFVISLACGIFLSRIKQGSSIFTILARESDIKEGKLVGLVYLFLTMATLIFINFLMYLSAGPDKFPLFIIGCAIAITTFGDGVADLINIHEKFKKEEQKNDIKVYSAKSSIVFLISGSLYAFIVGTWISDFTTAVPYGMIFMLIALITLFILGIGKIMERRK